MKLGIVCSSGAADHWGSIALAANSQMEVSFFHPETASVAGLDDFASRNEKLWIPGFISKFQLPVSTPCLYNSALLNGASAAESHQSSFPLRYRTGIIHLKEVAESGKLGSIGTVRLSVCRSTAPGGPLCYTEIPANAGAFDHIGIHGIDAIRWCFGDLDRHQVMHSSESPADGSLYALVAARLASGAIAHLECSLAEPPGNDYMTYEVAGANGILEFDSRKEPTLSLQSKSSEAKTVGAPPELIAELSAFLGKPA